MRYPASEKLEIIRLVEGSHLSARLTLAKLGIPRTTFYRWYDRYLQRGEVVLSRLRSGLSTHLRGLSLKCQGAFAA
jgi:transposase-like protein